MATVAFIIASVVFLVILLIRLGRSSEIQKCKSIESLVLAIDYGRAYPYKTGMSLNDVEYIVKKLYPNTDEFEKKLEMYKLFGRVPSLDLPDSSNAYIERITISFNKDNRVDSIAIGVKNFDINLRELLKELKSKFSNPMSADKEFIVWRNYNQVISVHSAGTIYIIDENLMSF